MSSIKHYSDLNEYLSAIDGIPLLKCEDFYIVKFEGEYQSNYQISYKHDFFEVNFAIGYDAILTIGEDQINPLTSNLSFISPGQISTWNIQDIKNESMGYMMLFKPSFLTSINDFFSIYKKFSYFSHFTSSGYSLDSRQLSLFKNIFEEIHREYDVLSQGNLEIIRAYLMIFLFNAKREIRACIQQNSFKTRSQEITHNFENLVVQTSKKYQSISYYADKLNISPVYLAECIKQATDKTTKHIINQYIIIEAKSLLIQTTELTSTIAFSLGFEDESNFTKYFKKHTGQTPRQFRLQS